MNIATRILPVLGSCLLASCVTTQPQGPYGQYGNRAYLMQTSDFAPPKSDPRFDPPPIPKSRTISRVNRDDSGSSPSRKKSRSTQIDGRTVIDTAPEDVEPVKTVPLEVDR